MIKKLSLSGASLISCELTETDNGVKYSCGTEFNMATLPETPELEGFKYLCAEVTNNARCSMFFAFVFSKKSSVPSVKPDFICAFGLLPGLRTKLVLALKDLDNQTMYPKRTPGRLKCIILGTDIEVSDIGAFSIAINESDFPQECVIHELYLTDEPPVFTEVTEKLVDELGQGKKLEWRGKTPSFEAMKKRLLSEYEEALPSDPLRSRFGGRSDMKLGEGTGFFRVCKYNGKYILCDPDGFAFLSMGINCVTPRIDTTLDGFRGAYDRLPEKYPDLISCENLYRVFGDGWYEAWTKLTVGRFVKWRFNTAANWSDSEFCRTSGIPYVNEIGGAGTKRNIYRDFPDVFSEEYKEDCGRKAESLLAGKDDPYKIGYFLRNEPHWAFVDGLCLASELLGSEYPFESKRELVSFLTKRYGSIDALNSAWGLSLGSFESLFVPLKRMEDRSAAAKRDLHEFSRLMVGAYNEIFVSACKKADPNHLCLGIRLGSINYNETNLSGSEFFDVMSFNCYKASPVDDISMILKYIDMPLIIGEYHHGAIDAGLQATGLVGVLTQKDRGDAYRYFCENAIASGKVVGAHYFQLNDQGFLGRGDGENFQIGFVDITNKPYEDFVNAAALTNDEIYDVFKGAKAPYSVQPHILHKIGI